MNMKKIASSILITLFVLCTTNIVSVAEENFKETELNIFTGMFDFSDDTQASGILGLQHQNEELYRKSFLGNLSPITGGFLTSKNAFYLYSGVQAEYDLGFLTITPIRLHVSQNILSRGRTIISYSCGYTGG